MSSVGSRGRLVWYKQNCFLNAAVDILLSCSVVLLALVVDTGEDSAEAGEDSVLAELGSIARKVSAGEKASTVKLLRLLGQAQRAFGPEQQCEGSNFIVLGQRYEACNVLSAVISHIQRHNPESEFAKVFAGAWNLTVGGGEICNVAEVLLGGGSFGAMMSLLDLRGSLLTTMSSVFVINVGHTSKSFDSDTEAILGARPEDGIYVGESDAHFALVSITVFYLGHLSGYSYDPQSGSWFILDGAIGRCIGHFADVRCAIKASKSQIVQLIFSKDNDSLAHMERHQLSGGPADSGSFSPPLKLLSVPEVVQLDLQASNVERRQRAQFRERIEMQDAMQAVCDLQQTECDKAAHLANLVSDYPLLLSSTAGAGSGPCSQTTPIVAVAPTDPLGRTFGLSDFLRWHPQRRQVCRGDYSSHVRVWVAAGSTALSVSRLLLELELVFGWQRAPYSLSPVRVRVRYAAPLCLLLVRVRVRVAVSIALPLAF